MLFFISIVIFLYIGRLFYLQVIQGEQYFAEAQKQQYGKIVIPARRGEIFMQSSKTGSLDKVATNTTLDLVYIDPQEIEDKELVAKKLAPILFSEEDFLACKKDINLCPSGGVKFDESQILLSKESEDIEIKDTRTKKQLIDAYAADLLEKINKEQVDYSPLLYGASEELVDEVNKLAIFGLYAIKNKSLVYANPLEIDQKNLADISSRISNIIDIPSPQIANMLRRRKVRYIPLKRKLSPEASEAIWDLKQGSYSAFKQDPKNNIHYFKGVVLVPEHWRYYPENELASTVIGYVDHEGIGNYGIEERFQEELKGQQGEFLSQNDVNGAQLIFDASKTKEAKDGISYVLTIDRVIQKRVDDILASAVERYNADYGNILVSDPLTGKILAMSDYPRFDPNDFGQVYQLREAKLEEWEEDEIYPTQPIFIKDEKGALEQVSYKFVAEELEALKLAREKIERGETEVNDNGQEVRVELPEETQKYVFKNRIGLKAYMNRNMMELYEPGSVFKPIAMSIALDAKEVTPYDVYQENGPIEIDTGTDEKQFIGNANDQYRGMQTMTNAIEYSSNIGMSYTARKLGRQLFYKYIKEFGFGDYSYINIVGEQKGNLTYWKQWPEAQLLTTSFGQGISVTPVQMLSAWGALANGGLVMQPQIISETIDENGVRHVRESKMVRRVISTEASQQISGMLVSSMENGVARSARVPGYRLAGKTGTSQIACSDSSRCQVGKYESGTGTTITSFAGYGPIHKPKFLILVKFDRPRIGDNNTWGSTTAAPVFNEVAEFLLNYYDIQPQE